MLAAEADRRGPTIISGIEELAASGKKDPDQLEELRVRPGQHCRISTQEESLELARLQGLRTKR